MAVCMSLLSTVSLSIIRSYTLHQTVYSPCIRHCHKQWLLESMHCPSIMRYTRIVIVVASSEKYLRGNVVNGAP